MSLDTAIIQQYYAGILRLTPSAATINAYAQLPSYEAAMDAMENAAVSSVNPITKLYQAAFDRVPDSAGLTNYTAAYGAGAGTMTLQQIATQWTGTIEFTTDYPASMPNADYVGLLYWNVLHRSADPVGAANFTAALNSGKMTRADVLLELSQSPEFSLRIDGHIRGFQEQCALNDPAAYTGTLWDKVSPEAGGTYTLTTNIDVVDFNSNATVVGVFAGLAAATTTLQAGDTLNGTGTNNTLKVVDTSAGVATVMAGVTMDGVQKVMVTAVGAGASTYALAPYDGITNVTSLNSTQTVNFTGLAAGTSVTASGAATTAGALNATYTLATSTPTVNFAGGVTGVTVTTIGGTATSAVINSTGGTNGTTAAGAAAANTVSFGAGGNIATLTVNAATNLRAIMTAGDFAAAGAALTVSGAATNVNLGTAGVYKTIDASGLTAGGVTVNASNQLTSFVGGAGNDNLTNNGAGTAAIAATASINAGTGVDTVAATLINSGNGAVFSGFDILSLTGAGAGATFDASILTNSVITGVSTGALGGGLVVSNLVENASGFDVTITASTGAASTLGFTAASVAGTADVIDYTFANTTAAGAVNANTITQEGIEIVNIASGGIAGSLNALTITDTALQTVNITGSQALTYATTAQTAYGANLVSQLTRIDGSTATGNLTITDNGTGAGTISKAAVTILGGSGNDTITVITNAAGTTLGSPAGFGGDTVTTGAGADNVNVTLAIAQSVTAPASTTITDLAVGDSVTGLGTVTAWNNTAVNVAAATSLVDALGIAAAAGDDDLGWFVYGGNTYLLFDDGAGGGTLDTTDVIVKLTGVVDLSTSTFAVDTLTIA